MTDTSTSSGDPAGGTSGRMAADDARTPASPPAPGNGEVGNALRSIYQQTVEEAVPNEMIDLLGRLG